MRPSRSGFDSEWGAFCTDLMLSEFKPIGFIELIRCLILNVPNVCFIPWLMYPGLQQTRSIEQCCFEFVSKASAVLSVLLMCVCFCALLVHPMWWPAASVSYIPV